MNYYVVYEKCLNTRSWFISKSLWCPQKLKLKHTQILKTKCTIPSVMKKTKIPKHTTTKKNTPLHIYGETKKFTHEWRKNLKRIWSWFFLQKWFHSELKFGKIVPWKCGCWYAFSTKTFSLWWKISLNAPSNWTFFPFILEQCAILVVMKNAFKKFLLLEFSSNLFWDSKKFVVYYFDTPTLRIS